MQDILKLSDFSENTVYYGRIRISKIQIWTGPDPQNSDLDWSGSAKFRIGLVWIRKIQIWTGPDPQHWYCTVLYNVYVYVQYVVYTQYVL